MIQKRFKLFIQAFLIEFRKVMAYRWEFWSGFLGQTTIVVVISYFLWKAIFENNGVTAMKGMVLTDFVLYYLVAHLVFKTMLGPNIGFISHDIYYGTLNKFLVFPISFQFFKLASYLAHSFFFFVQLALLVSLHKLIVGNSIDMASFAMGSITLLSICYCYFLLSAIIEMIAFWADNIWSLLVLLRAFLHFCGGYLVPLDFYPEFVQKIIYKTPFPYLIYEPVQIFTGKTSFDHFLSVNFILLSWCLILFFLYRVVWLQGNRQYTGVGI